MKKQRSATQSNTTTNRLVRARIAALIMCLQYVIIMMFTTNVRSTSAEAVKTLVQAFISCRLDYCNSPFLRHHRMSDKPAAVCPLQNAAPRLVSGARRYDHITPVLGAALASSSTSGAFQDGHPGLPVTVRHGSSLSGHRLRLPVGFRRRSSSAAFCYTSRTCVVR